MSAWEVKYYLFECDVCSEGAYAYGSNIHDAVNQTNFYLCDVIIYGDHWRHVCLCKKHTKEDYKRKIGE